MSGPLLVDTPVWIEHFSGRRPEVAERIRSEPVCVHDFIIGELMLGVLPRGHPAIRHLEMAPRLPALAHDRVVAFAIRHRLEGSGIGWVDAHLLASAESAGARIWTTDRSLRRAAARLDVLASA